MGKIVVYLFDERFETRDYQKSKPEYVWKVLESHKSYRSTKIKFIEKDAEIYNNRYEKLERLTTRLDPILDENNIRENLEKLIREFNGQEYPETVVKITNIKKFKEYGKDILKKIRVRVQLYLLYEEKWFFFKNKKRGEVLIKIAHKKNYLDISNIILIVMDFISSIVFS